ncbi:hypothetical protein Sjap_005439 [Stephania japonica]|uniref:Uncharacterized protein n=1 Tax=Stephania japonica TaxID=461633 RepID=A0AAP0K494_9MAGN
MCMCSLTLSGPMDFYTEKLISKEDLDKSDQELKEIKDGKDLGETQMREVRD